MTWCDPLNGRVFCQQFLIESDGLVIAPEFAKSWLEAFADFPEALGDFAKTVRVRIGCRLDGIQINEGRRFDERNLR